MEAQKHQFAMYMKSKNAKFLDSLLQQFKFEEAKEVAPVDKGEYAAIGKEREGESEQDYQAEQKEVDDAEAKTESSEGEEEEEWDIEDEDKEEELSKVTPSRKSKEKLLEEEG